MKNKNEIMHTLKLIGRISKIGSWGFLCSVIGSLGVGLCNFAFNFLVGKLSETAIQQSSAGIFNEQAFIKIAFAFIGGVLIMVLGQMMNLSGGQFAERKLKTKLSYHILRQKESDIRASHTGDMMTLLTSDAGAVEDYYFQGLSNMFIFPTVIGIAAIITTFSILPVLGFVSILFGVISFIVSSRYSKKVQNAYTSSRRFANESTNQLSEILGNEALIRLNGIQDNVVASYDDSNQLNGHAIMDAENTKHKVTLLNNSFKTITTILFLMVGIYLTQNQGFDFSKLMLLLPLQGSISYMFGSFNVAWNYLLEVSTSAERICKLLDNPLEDLQDTLPDFEVLDSAAEFELRDVSFSYSEDVKILDNLSLTLPARKMSAIVGQSGSGKSTLFQLLLGFYQKSDGAILLSNTSIAERSITSLRNQIIYVQQETPLFNRSISDNIRLGSRHYDQVTQEDIENAAKKAGIHDFIMSLPEHYETMVGENASRISGGQRQRIVIARAFISDAPILIMDEPTSALDSESEAKIQEALERIRAEKTLIIAAHRLSTIQDADNIIVLEQGRVVEQGNHEALISKKKNYYEYVKSQMTLS